MSNETTGAPSPRPAPDYSLGLEDLAGLITFRVGAWHDFGYEVPPSPECKTVPPLGERSAEAIKAGHEAVGSIDELTRQLYALREQLVGELRRDEDLRAVRVDAMLAERPAPAGTPCGLCRLRAERGIEQPPGGCTCQAEPEPGSQAYADKYASAAVQRELLAPEPVITDSGRTCQAAR